MRVLVTGGRDFADRALLESALDELHRRHRIHLLIQGGARGADRLGCDWAAYRSVTIETFRADWKKYGKAAGAIRNQRMLDEAAPELVVAFQGGKGTADMCRRAEDAGIKVLRVKESGY
jgi:hypothetical protein